MKNTHITPTTDSPIFKAHCDFFGYIDESTWKDYEIDEEYGCTGSVFAINFADAIQDLHEWIKNNLWAVAEYPKCKFEIYAMDGSEDKKHSGQPAQVKVYTITAAKAKRFLLDSRELEHLAEMAEREALSEKISDLYKKRRTEKNSVELDKLHTRREAVVDSIKFYKEYQDTKVARIRSERSALELIKGTLDFTTPVEKIITDISEIVESVKS